MPLGFSGSRRLLDRLVTTEMGLCSRGYSVPNQGCSGFEPGSFIIPSGSALLQVLEPGCMIGMHHPPTKGLSVLPSSPASEWPFSS